jgi:hypothetical protein
VVNRSELLNLTELRARGWTPAMIRRLLGTEDAVRRNPIYRTAAPQRLYKRERVLAAEESMDFEAARAGSLHRAERGRAIAARKKAGLLKEIGRLEVRVTKLDAKTLRRRAIAHYEERQYARDGYDFCTPEGAMLERITVNYIRHELTEYDDHLDALFGRIGKQAAIFAVREKVYAAIAAAYPQLAAECQRQLDARREPPAAELQTAAQPPHDRAPASPPPLTNAPAASAHKEPPPPEPAQVTR